MRTTSVIVLLSLKLLPSVSELLKIDEEYDFRAIKKEFVSISENIKHELEMTLNTPFFRYFKIDLEKKCPFWDEPQQCFNEHCSVSYLPESTRFENLRFKSLSDVEFPPFIKVSNLKI